MASPASTLRRFRPYSRLTSALCAGTATVALTLAPSCSSRSGGGAPASPAPAAAQAAPEILHFGEDKTSILAGQTLDLKADFANGTAVIEPGHLVVTSGETIALTPSETTTYTLTVTDSAGATTTETASVTVAPLTHGMALLAGEFNGTGNADGVGALARFRSPRGVAVDPSGNVFVADTENFTIRRIAPDGTVTTLAGTAGQNGELDATIGISATFAWPTKITLDAAGNLYVIDRAKAIRKVTPNGAVSHVVAHEAGSTNPHVFVDLTGLVVDKAGTLFVTDGGCTIEKITSDGTVTTLAGAAGQTGYADGTGDTARFAHPYGIALGADGNLYVADSGNRAIRMVTPLGVVSTLAGNAGNSMVDGPVASAIFEDPDDIAVDPSGTIFINDGSSTVRQITADGIVSTLAGDPAFNESVDGIGTAAHFVKLAALAVDSKGNVYAADAYGCVIRKITPEAEVSTLAGKAERQSQSVSSDGMGESAHFKAPGGLAADGAGNTYVADLGGNAIRKVSSTGEVTTLAGQFDLAGFQDGQADQALFDEPSAAALDSQGNIYVVDPRNSVVRMITSLGLVSTLAGNPGQGGLQDGTGPGALFSFNAAPSIAVDGGGHVLVTEPFRVRRIDANGVTTTVAGSIQGTTGFADSSKPLDALFYGLSGIAVDAAGVIYVADGKNCLIRQIAPSGGVTTLAGSWPPGNQDGPSGVARFGKLGNLTLDSKGQYLYVADTTNNSIRKISTSDGTVTTVVGTRDIQGTVPGPLPATLNAPTGVAWDPTGPGHLLISVPDAILRVTF